MNRVIQTDVTGTVNLADAAEVAREVCRILAARYGDAVCVPVRRAFNDVAEAFWGRYGGFLPCDTPYHDLRHSLGTALLLTRMIDGYASAPEAEDLPIDGTLAALAIVLALMHDIGFLRHEDEEEINGATLVHAHEVRGVEFARAYLLGGELAAYADWAELILVTNFTLPIAEVLAGRPPVEYLLGRMLGTADLLSQLSGRYYLERCRFYLFREFVVAGATQRVAADGTVTVLYESPEDLLRKTPGFYNHLVKRRMECDFEHAYRYVEAHFGGANPYMRALERNLAFLQEMIDRDDFSALHRRPVPVIPGAVAEH